MSPSSRIRPPRTPQSVVRRSAAVRQRMRQANWPLPNLGQHAVMPSCHIMYSLCVPSSPEEDDGSGGEVGDQRQPQQQGEGQDVLTLPRHHLIVLIL